MERSASHLSALRYRTRASRLKSEHFSQSVKGFLVSSVAELIGNWTGSFRFGDEKWAMRSLRILVWDSVSWWGVGLGSVPGEAVVRRRWTDSMDWVESRAMLKRVNDVMGRTSIDEKVIKMRLMRRAGRLGWEVFKVLMCRERDWGERERVSLRSRWEGLMLDDLGYLSRLSEFKSQF